MPHVEILIGGRTFEVACQDGEEHFLHSAAAILNTEASHLSEQIGRMPEARMLLMAGLMLADKTAGLEEKVREVEGQLEQLQSRPTATKEVPVIPAAVTETLAEIAANAEALADAIEGR